MKIVKAKKCVYSTSIIAPEGKKFNIFKFWEINKAIGEFDVSSDERIIITRNEFAYSTDEEWFKQNLSSFIVDVE